MVKVKEICAFVVSWKQFHSVNIIYSVDGSHLEIKIFMLSVMVVSFETVNDF